VRLNKSHIYCSNFIKDCSESIRSNFFLDNLQSPLEIEKKTLFLKKKTLQRKFIDITEGNLCLEVTSYVHIKIILTIRCQRNRGNTTNNVAFKIHIFESAFETILQVQHNFSV